jgi:BirA family biotin operon repressor/biotin-[acetyl-CoA-carboxylase] ligase
MWRAIESVARTGSTNADLLARARQGAPEGTVLVAEEQTAGRGRMNRSWVSPPGAALTFSFLLRPAAIPVPRQGWLPLLAGVAVAAAVRGVTGADATLKWPNDVLARGGKLAGILAEATGDAVVIGIGLNVSTGPDELPPPGPGGLPATSLRILGVRQLAREPLLTGILLSFERRYTAWRAARGHPAELREEYKSLCETLNRQVRVERPGGQVLSGEAVDVDSDGRLLVLMSSAGAAVAGRAVVPVAAGDVVHVRLPQARAVARQASGTAGTRYRRSKSAISGGRSRIVAANAHASPAPGGRARQRAISSTRPPSRITPSSVPRRSTHF